MLIVISPAKRLDWDVAAADMTRPRLQDQADILAGHARQLGVGDLKSLMSLSDKLARLNRDRFQAMKQDDPDDRRPAALAFAGDTYQGLEMATLDAPARDVAQRRLRILSGLYGVLRPFDGIRPYRLEMGTRLATRRGTSLYAFWSDRIARMLKDDAETAGTDVLVNCASKEYFDAVDLKALGLRVVTPRFLDPGPKGPRVISFNAKRARGAMARFICETGIREPDGLKDFDAGGYRFSPDLSEPGSPAFLRAEDDGAP